jgi:hypothetical protein
MQLVARDFLRDPGRGFNVISLHFATGGEELSGPARPLHMDHRIDYQPDEAAELGPSNRMRAYVVLAITIGALFVCFLLPSQTTACRR